MKITNLNVHAIRKQISELPKTPALQVLRKQLVNYEKYKGDPDLAWARNHLAQMIWGKISR